MITREIVYRNIDYYLNHSTLSNHELQSIPYEYREKNMSEETQAIHDEKVARIEVMYKDLPPYAQEFVDKYRDDIKKLGRLNGNGPNEILRFIADLKKVIDANWENYKSCATKGGVGFYTKGSGV